MNTILKRMLIAMAALLGVLGLNAGIASAATQHAAAPAATQHSLFGQCGGPSLTKSGLLTNLDKMGATGSASKFFGIQPLNETLANRVHTTFAVATLARDATIQNEGCSGGALFGAGPKHLPAGTKVWIDMTSLKAKFPNGFSLNPKGKGWKRMAVAVQFRAQTTCTNPGKATVVVFVWVKVNVTVTPAPKVPVSKPQPVCIDIHGAPLFAIPPGTTIQNGVCVNVTVTTVACNGNQQSVSNSQGVVIACIDIVNVNNNTNNNNVVVNVPPPAPCNCTSPPPVTPPVVTPAPSVTITSMTTLNDIPTGKTSGPFNITVNASAPGTITIDPGVGGISGCNGSTPTGSFQTSLTAGNNSICVILYAPSDSGVTSMTITATAIVSTAGGTAKDVKNQTFTISYPVRP